MKNKKIVTNEQSQITVSKDYWQSTIGNIYVEINKDYWDKCE